MTRILIACVVLLSLSACGAGTGLVLVGASTATLIHTDKTVVDHAVGLTTNRDCSLLYLARDEEYCKPLNPIEPAQIAAMSAQLYCYRTLGGVTCYDRPDYTASSQTRIVFGDTLIAPLESHEFASLSKAHLQGSTLGGMLAGAALGGPVGAVVGGVAGSTVDEVLPPKK